MKTVAVILLLLLLSSTFVSCGTDVDEAWLEQARQKIISSQPEPVVMVDEAGFLDGVYPGAIAIYGELGTIADTWTDDDVNGYYREGDPTGVIITNDADEEMEYVVWLENMTNGECKTLYPPVYGIERAPDGYESWVVIRNWTTSVPAHTSTLIPVGLVLPEGASTPTKWEFQVFVRDKYAQVAAANGQRWIIVLPDRSLWSRTWFKVLVVALSTLAITCIAYFLYQRRRVIEH